VSASIKSPLLLALRIGETKEPRDGLSSRSPAGFRPKPSILTLNRRKLIALQKELRNSKDFCVLAAEHLPSER